MRSSLSVGQNGVGAGIGAELGAMRATEQIDALEASAVDPVAYLVVTRVIASGFLSSMRSAAEPSDLTRGCERGPAGEWRHPTHSPALRLRLWSPTAV